MPENLLPKLMTRNLKRRRNPAKILVKLNATYAMRKVTTHVTVLKKREGEVKVPGDQEAATSQ